MNKDFYTIDVSLMQKQKKAMHLCYDNMIAKLEQGESDQGLAKCMEVIRKDMAATCPVTSDTKNNSINDTIERMLEMEKSTNRIKDE